MKTIKLISLTSILLASSQMFADYYLFKGSDGDVTNYENFYSLTDVGLNDVYSRSIYLYPSDYAGTVDQMRASSPETQGGIVAKYSNATSLYGSKDVLYFYAHRFADTSKDPVEWSSTTPCVSPINFKESKTVGEILIRSTNTTFNLGDSASTNKAFSLNVENLRVGYNSAFFYAAENAAQDSISINVSNEITFRGGSYCTIKMGKATGFIDKISANSFVLEDKIYIHANSISVGEKGFNLGKDAALNLFVNDNFFTKTQESFLLSVDGVFKKAATNKISIDFSNIASVEESNSGVYNLISAGSLSGFDTSDTKVDFSSSTFDSIAAIFGDNANLEWRGNNLQLFVNVPEPATFAAAFAFVALALAAWRRRK